MRIPRIQFTVRQLMTVVVGGALLLAAISPGRRFLYCMREADRYRRSQVACLAEIKRIEISAAKHGTRRLQEIRRRERERAERARRTGEFLCLTYSLGSYQRQLESAIRDGRTYRRAAFRPWEPMPNSYDCGPGTVSSR